MNTGSASSRYVLGVNTGPHDASAALLRDGHLVAMAEQERLSRRRHALCESPREAIVACLAQEGIDLGAVAQIAVGWDVPTLVDLEEAGPFDEGEFVAWLLGDLRSTGRPPPLRYVEHHLAHAASAFYTSGMSEAAILVVDGRGESVATSLAIGGPGGIETLRTWGTHLSLGLLYGCAAEWAGLTIWGAGKLMGLAAYGRPRQPAPLSAGANDYTIADALPAAEPPISSHQVKLRRRLREGFRERNYPFCPADPADVMAYADFAASVQNGLEEVLLNLAAIARRETGQSKLVLAGGVALNCTANGALIRSAIFDEVWIPPFPYDAGVSVGAALVADRASRQSPPPPTRLPHALWGPSTDSADLGASALLDGCDVSEHSDPHLAEVVARHLEEGRLVGWWQGRAEVGQRALGARSILCDPRDRKTLLRANLAKGREPWRPLAPAVLAEQADKLFDDALPAAADFMLAAWPVDRPSQIPAAVHADGSARPQVVRPGQARYHDVIEAFHERTGVPAVINTSFNLAGEPIVLSAQDAVSTFLRSDLDVLVLGDLIAVKQATEVSRAPAESRPVWVESGVGISRVLPWVRASSRT